MQLTHRPRRNRKSRAIRELIQENRLNPADFVLPIFVLDGNCEPQGIGSMPGIYRRSLEDTYSYLEEVVSLGVRSVDIFPVIDPSLKNREGSYAWHREGLCQRAIAGIKERFPQLCVMVDLALDPYTSHGHDGIVNDQGDVLNDETLEALGRAALLQAEFGADMIAPSDMMDGRIGYLRALLDAHGYSNVGLMSYTAKYASSFYGPFRDALSSGLQKGDKKTYQMDPANRREAVREALLDVEEGADMLMVKPALAYLDVILELKEQTCLPIAAYHVSGEYAMVMAAAEKGWLDGEAVLYESLLGIKRAGADMIFSYAAPQVLRYQQQLGKL